MFLGKEPLICLRPVTVTSTGNDRLAAFRIGDSMKEILLTQGKVAIVDDDMYEYLSQWKWCAHFDGKIWYADRNEGKFPFRKTISMHRVVIDAPDGVDVDHVNGDGLHNWRGNLRHCTKSENGRNRGKNKGNTSGFKGVSWSKQKRKYEAYIKVHGKQTRLGFFATAEEAAHAYDSAAKSYHGEFARLNFE